MVRIRSQSPARRLRNAMAAAGFVMLALAAATPFAALAPSATLQAVGMHELPAIDPGLDAESIQDATTQAADEALRDATPRRQARRGRQTLAMPYFSFSRS